jgi:hypothetical protein
VHDPASVTLRHNLISQSRAGTERAGLELVGHASALLFGNLFVRHGSPAVLGTIDEKALKDNDNAVIDRREGIARPPGRSKRGNRD